MASIPSHRVLTPALGLLSALAISSCDQGSSRSGNSTTQLRTYGTTYGTTADERVHDLHPTHDFGHIVAGTTDALGDGDTEGWLIKHDLDGNVEWARSYGDGAMDLRGNSGLGWSANEAFDTNEVSVTSSDDGGCLVAGGTFDGNVSDGGVLGPVFKPTVIKLDPNGRVEWRCELAGGERGGRLLAIERPEWDDGVFVAGYVESRGNNLDARNRDVLLASIAADGSIRWQATYGGAQHEVATAIDFVSGGRGAVPYAITVVGNRTKGPGAEGNVGLFMQIERHTQRVLIEETLGLRDGVNFVDVRRSEFTGHFTVTGAVKRNQNDYYESNRDNSFDALVVEYHGSSGDKRWHEIIELAPQFDNAPEYGFGLAQSPLNRGFFVAGYGGILSRDAAVFCVDEDGNFDRDDSRTFGENDLNEEFHAIRETRAGAYVVAGQREDQVWVGVLGINLEFEWQQFYDLPAGAGRAHSVTESYQNGNAIGYLVSGEGPAGGWVMHLGRVGQVRWMRTIHDRTDDALHAVRQTDDDGDGRLDDGYVAVGTSGSGTWLDDDAWLLKTDAVGQVEWQRRLGRVDQDDRGFAVETTPDGILVAGSTTLQEGVRDLVFQWYDVSGNLQWQRIYGQSLVDDVRDLVIAEDGSIHFVASSRFGGFAGKLTPTGLVDPTWSSLQFTSCVPTAVALGPDGRVVVGGAWNKSVEGRNADDTWLTVLTPNGTVETQAIFPSLQDDYADTARAIVWTEAGITVAADSRSLALTGETCQDEDGRDVPCGNVHVLHLDDALRVDWERTYSNVYEDEVRAIRWAADGTLILGGTTDSRFLVTGDDARGMDAWIVKMEPDGTVSTSCPSYGKRSTSDRATRNRSTASDLENASDLGFVSEPTTLRSNSLDSRIVTETLCGTRGDTYKLRVVVRGSGRVVDPRHNIDCSSTCELPVREGLPIRLEPIAADGSTFLGWSDECPTGSFDMLGPVTCTARFDGDDGPSDPGGDGDFSGYWEVDLTCEETCSYGEPEDLSDIHVIQITVDGNSALVIDYNSNGEFAGTIRGNTLTWSGSYTLNGTDWTEAGTFVLGNDDRIVVESTYTREDDTAGCSGTCTGTGGRY